MTEGDKILANGHPQRICNHEERPENPTRMQLLGGQAYNSAVPWSLGSNHGSSGKTKDEGS